MRLAATGEWGFNMSIPVACPSCGKGLKAPDSAAGKRAKCPACGHAVTIPEVVQEAGEVIEQLAARPVPGAAEPPEIRGPAEADEYRIAARTAPELPQAAAPLGGENRRPCPMCKEMIVATAVKCRFCGELFDSPFRGDGFAGPIARPHQAVYGQGRGLQYSEQGFRSLYLWFAILYGVGIPAVLLVIGIFMLIAAIVLQWILVYRCWDVIQDGEARTTPGKAIGFLFIPFFNFYWIFVAIHGLAKDMEEYCRRRSLPCSVSPALALNLCVLTLCSLVPYLGIITALINLVVIFILLHQFKETAITILRYRQLQMGRAS